MKKLLTKKLAEVYAFAQVSSDTYKQGENALSKVFDRDYVQTVRKVNEETVTTLNNLTKNQPYEPLFKDSAKKTEEKIKKMRTIYLEDKWNESDEVLEWLGFIEGSASVHWSLVEQLALEEKMSEIKTIAGKMKEYHTKLLQKLEQAIKESE